MTRVVIAGGGLGGFRVARSLRDSGFAGDVVVVSDEHHLPYDRPPLSKQLLAGTFTAEQCALPGQTDDIDWRLGHAVTSVNCTTSQLTLADATMLDFDELVIATGRRARMWPGSTPTRGVHTLRSLDDVATLQASVTPQTPVVIIGAGFVGCEVAATLRRRDIAVTVIDVAAQPMPVIGTEAGALARTIHQQHGVQWRLGASITDIIGDDHVSGVRLDSGEVIPAAVVLVSIGSLPNTEFLADTALAMTGGVIDVAATGQALDTTGAAIPHIWAVGDVAAWPHPHAERPVCIEHWSNARDMADVVAANITHPGEPVEIKSTPSFWSDQYDVKIKSVGYLRGADELVVLENDVDRRVFVAEARRGGEIIGAITFNKPKALLGYQRALRSIAA